MSINILPTLTSKFCSIDMIRDEVRQLVETGSITRRQPIYSLCRYIPAREWVHVEHELERYSYLLRDRVGDLIGSEKWDND